jgi:glycosyltransferase involved in cell wall biosynthesis
VEACAAGLPLLASTRIGNFEDVVVEGENGWAYDPSSPEGFRDLVRRVASLDRTEMQRRGGLSRELHRRRFDTRTCITRVGEFLREVHARSRGAV